MDNKRKHFGIPYPSTDSVQAADGTEEFVAVYTINVRAKKGDVQGAALAAEEIMRNGDYRPCLHILTTEQHPEFIDLESLEVHE